MTYTEIQEMIENLLKRMKISFDEVKVVEDGERLRVAIFSSDSRHLIGNQGANLSALNHVVRRMSEQVGNTTPFTVDVNDYYEESLESIRNKAKISAERAISFKTNIEMDPMNSYERMIVHSVLAQMSDISTESSGYGKERRVIVRYSPSNDELDGKI